MNGLSDLYASSEVPSYGWLKDAWNKLTGKQKGIDLKATARAANYLGKGQDYYDAFLSSLDMDALPIGTPTDYIRNADHAFDEYTRRDPHLMHVALYGYDPDGTAAEWATQALEGDSAKRAANIGRIHYGKFGKGEGRQLLAPGYYDAQGNMVRPPESSALQEIINTAPVEPEYQEYEPGLNFLTNEQLADQGVTLSDNMIRNMNLRPEKYIRKAAPQKRANDYIEFMKAEGNEDLLNNFKVSMNLTPELLGADVDQVDDVRSLLELYGANSFMQNLGGEGVEMPTIGLEQVFDYSPERKTDTYIDNLKRLYKTNTPTNTNTVESLEDRLATRRNYVAPEAEAKDYHTMRALSQRPIYGQPPPITPSDAPRRVAEANAIGRRIGLNRDAVDRYNARRMA